jgi:pimeloyl-ACP methyl ester carboxylesterase
MEIVMGFASVLVWLAVVVVTAALLATGFFMHVTRRISREAEKLVPAAGKRIRVDGHDIHYVESGEGPAILMIHGLGGHLHHMRRPLMEEFGDDYRLIAIDRPGSGYSTRARGDGRLSQQADFIARFIDEMKLDRPLIVGHSLGGTVALATALRHPDKVRGLALLAPLTQAYSEVPPEFAPLYIPNPVMRRLIAQTVAVPMSAKNAPRTLDFVFSPQKPPADFAVAGGALAGLRPSHIYATSTDLVALRHDLADYENRYDEIDMPVGILFGDKDRVLNHRRHGLSMRDKIRGLDLEIAEGIGHMPQYAVTEQVVAFIRRIADKAFDTHPATAG